MELEIVLLALGIAGIAEWKELPFFRLLSAPFFFVAGFEANSDLALLGGVGIGMIQIVRTFLGDTK